MNADFVIISKATLAAYPPHVRAHILGASPEATPPTPMPASASLASTPAPAAVTSVVDIGDQTVPAFLRKVDPKTRRILRAFLPSGRASVTDLVRAGSYSQPGELRGWKSGMAKRLRALGLAGPLFRIDGDDYVLSDVTRDALSRYFARSDARGSVTKS